MIYYNRRHDGIAILPSEALASIILSSARTGGLKHLNDVIIITVVTPQWLKGLPYVERGGWEIWIPVFKKMQLDVGMEPTFRFAHMICICKEMGIVKFEIL